MRVEWTPGARADLLGIIGVIARDRPDTARKQSDRIRRAVSGLSDFPEMGRVVPEVADPSVRELILRPYRVIYRLTPERIEVFAVVHSRRELVGRGG